jgi:hypothetical protein
VGRHGSLAPAVPLRSGLGTCRCPRRGGHDPSVSSGRNGFAMLARPSPRSRYRLERQRDGNHQLNSCITHCLLCWQDELVVGSVLFFVFELCSSLPSCLCRWPERVADSDFLGARNIYLCFYPQDQRCVVSYRIISLPDLREAHMHAYAAVKDFNARAAMMMTDRTDRMSCHIYIN